MAFKQTPGFPQERRRPFAYASTVYDRWKQNRSNETNPLVISRNRCLSAVSENQSRVTVFCE